MSRKPWEGKVKQIHFRIEWELFRRFRSQFPDKGDMQRIFRQILIEFLNKHNGSNEHDRQEGRTT